MNVLMRDTFLPGNTYSLELCKYLSEYVNITLLCKSDVSGAEEKVHCKKIIYTKGSNKLTSICKYIISIHNEIKEIKNGNYNVYHIQSYKNLFLEIPVFYYAKRHCNCVVTTVHNVLPHEVSKQDRRLHDEWYKLSDVLIVHNEATKNCFVDQFPNYKEKIRVVPHGIYTKGIPANIKVREYNEKRTFLMFGQIRPYKGLDVLIKAVTYLSQETRKNIKILIVGGQHPKQDPTNYENLIELVNIEDCVDFQKKRIPDEELPALFESIDFTLFPYKEIYGSGALLMSYTYEKPVIASNVPAFVEETDEGKTGLLFQSENPVDLARCIEIAANLSLDDIKKYRKSIRKLVEEKYNWKVSAKKITEIYKEAIVTD